MCGGSVSTENAPTVPAEKWILKQVQDDGWAWWKFAAYNHPIRRNRTHSPPQIVPITPSTSG